MDFSPAVVLLGQGLDNLFVSFLKEPQPSRPRDFILALNSPQFMGIFTQLALLSSLLHLFHVLKASFWVFQRASPSLIMQRFVFLAAWLSHRGRNAPLWNKRGEMCTSHDGQSLCSTSGNIPLPGLCQVFHMGCTL